MDGLNIKVIVNSETGQTWDLQVNGEWEKDLTTAGVHLRIADAIQAEMDIALAEAGLQEY